MEDIRKTHNLFKREIIEAITIGRDNPTVLDVGCGSGILGIAALKFGARQALGIDINPASDAISQANAQAN